MINFDILYKKKLETDSIKLIGESYFRQLKLMICGKYQIYDYNNLFIYYKNNKIVSDDNTKLKEIFKTKKAKIEITEKEKEITKQNNNTLKINIKSTCTCGGAAAYLCEKCEEFLCNFCLKHKKHITHNKNIINLNDYYSYTKKYLKELANQLDNKVINDEAYKFLKYWDYDKDREIKAINNLYDYIKEQIEDIKQLEIDFIINLSENNKYNELKIKIQNALNDYTSFNLDAEIEQIFEQKKALLQNSQSVLLFYNEIKTELLKYTKAIKEFQFFNQEFQKVVQNKFNYMKKKFNSNNINNLNISTMSYNNFNTTYNNDNNLNDISNKILSKNSSMENLTSHIDKNTILINVRTVDKLPKNRKSKNKMSKKIIQKSKTLSSIPSSTVVVDKETSPEKIKEKEFEQLSKSILNSSQVRPNKKKKTRYNSINSTSSVNSTLFNNNIDSNILLKLKDKRKILIFNLKTQIFKEKIYFDKTNFRKELTSEADVIQLNLNNNLYMLSGKQNNKFYYYDYYTNSVVYINNCLYSHYYGTMIFCKKNKNIYLLGGNNQKNCEVYNLFLNSNNFKTKKKWQSIAPLNEERQEFGAMIYNDDYLYAFFGFSHIKGYNLSSIERININTHDYFEVVYVNEQITLSSIGCALINENDNNPEGGILLLGGFDGEKYIETSLIFSPEQMKIKECDIIIPNISKHFQFLFHKEANFKQIDDNLQVVYDMKNNVHVLTNHSYELFSEVE